VGAYVLDLTGDTEEGHVVSAAGGTFDGKVIPVIHPEPLKTLDEEKVDG
jgi:hypothetical protein